jgi:hypothetical protein
VSCVVYQHAHTSKSIDSIEDVVEPKVSVEKFHLQKSEVGEEHIKAMLFNSITQMMDRYDEDEDPIEMPNNYESILQNKQTLIEMSYNNSLQQSNMRYSMVNRVLQHRSSMFVDEANGKKSNFNNQLGSIISSSKSITDQNSKDSD